MNKIFNALINLYKGAQKTFERFPITTIDAFTATGIGFLLFYNFFDVTEQSHLLTNSLLTLFLGFPLFISLQLFSEVKNLSKDKSLLLKISGIVFLIIYYLLLPQNIFIGSSIYIFWMIGFMLLVTFISFLSQKATIEGFWEYTKILLKSIIKNIFYAVFIYSGISIAFASADFLFNLGLDGDRYFDLWLIILGVFSPLFFLSHIPSHPEKIKKISQYPNELKIFTQYVLLPLVTLYFIILYAYSAKILITGEWPEGIISYMILGFSFLGVIAYYFLYPLIKKNHWALVVEKILFGAFIPQTIMLFWAISFRVKEYGITENRYLIILFGAWLLGISLYFLFGKKRDIRILPISLFLIVFLASFGPWGAFSISESSQKNRLEKLLISNNILENNIVVKTDKEISFDDRKEISATIEYLYEIHGPESINHWFEEDISAFEEYSGVEETVKIMGIKYINRWESRGNENNDISIHKSNYTEYNNVSGYDYLSHISLYGKTNQNRKIDTLNLSIQNDSQLLTITDEKKNILIKSFLKEPLLDLIQKHKDGSITDDDLFITDENNNIKLKINISHIYAKEDNEEYNINSFDGDILIDVK